MSIINLHHTSSRVFLIVVAFALLSAMTPGQAASFPTPTHVAKQSVSSAPIPGGGFEKSDVNTWEFLKNWNGWSFRAAGIVKEGQGYASAYPNLESGTHALFLHGKQAYATRTTSQAAGVYQITFWAGRRNLTEDQKIRVEVNGKRVFQDSIKPNEFSSYSTLSYRHNGGSFNVKFSGLVDHKATVVDNVRIAPVSLWNAPSAWVGGEVPQSYKHTVEIPSGTRMAIPETYAVKAGDIMLKGSLDVLSGDNSIRTRTLIVHGQTGVFSVGSLAVKHLGEFKLTFVSRLKGRNIEGFGNNVLGARMGGRIELHGRSASSYGKLFETAQQGAETIKVRNASGWRVNDKIVISSMHQYLPSKHSRFNREDRTEVRRITHIDYGKGYQEIHLDRPLERIHLGVNRQYSRTKAPAKNWDIELRAYVGLLTRNVKLHGIRASEKSGSGFGGHVMIMGAHHGMMHSGLAQFSGVEFHRMGQKSMLGRYPFHWHMCESAGKGQSIRDCSIYKSFNRAITIHGTWHTLVQKNIAYDHLGHGLFLEDGSEQYNNIRQNLVMRSRAPEPGEELTPTDNAFLNSAGNRSPSSFWITNPKNYFVDNIVADTDGTAYWMAFPDQPTGASAADSRFDWMRPRNTSLGEFRGNSAYTCAIGIDFHDSLDPDTLELNSQPWLPEGTQVLKKFTAVGNFEGIYSGLRARDEQIVFDDPRLLDNHWHTMLASYATLRFGLVVDRSDPSDSWPLFAHPSRMAINLYDGPGRFYENHFVGYNQDGAILARSGGGAGPRTNWIFRGNSYDRVGFPRFQFGPFNGDRRLNTNAMVSLIDEDGSLSGFPGHSIISNFNSMASDDDIDMGPLRPGLGWMRASKLKFLSVRTNFPGHSYRKPAMRVTRLNWDGSAGARTDTNAWATIPNRTFNLVKSSPDLYYKVNFPDGVYEESEGVPLPYAGDYKKISMLFTDAKKGEYLYLLFENLNSEDFASNVSSESDWNQFRSSNNSCYFKSGNDVWVKFVSTVSRFDERDELRLEW